MTSGSGGASTDDRSSGEVNAGRVTSIPEVAGDEAGRVTSGPGSGSLVDRNLVDSEPTPRSATKRRPEKPQKPLPLWQETILMVGTAIVLALLIKTFFVQAFYIPSGSMRDTLEVNDRILVQKVSYWFDDVHRGDVVVFDDPANWLGEEAGQVPGNALTKALSFVGLYPSGGHLVKRVIGVGGDAVSCRQGEVHVNGVALQESRYVTLSQQACDGRWSVVVPQDHIWVLGDNRQHSADSRAHIGDPGGGFIPVGDIVGKAFVIVWPIDRWQFVTRPGTFGNPTLDQAATVITGSAPIGLAALAVPALLRRRKTRTRSR